jgi:hypothetical protein
MKIPAKIHLWISPIRRKNGRPRSWNGVTKVIEKGGMGAEDAQDQILWRRKLGR